MPNPANLILRLPNGSRELLVPNGDRVAKVLIHPTKQSTFAKHRPLFAAGPPGAKPTLATATAKVGVNKEFFRQLKAILNIIIPRNRSKEVFLIVAHTSFLLLRTYLSLLVAQLDGRLVGDLVSPLFSSSSSTTNTHISSQVSANGPGFLQGLVYWFALAIPSVYTNSMVSSALLEYMRSAHLRSFQIRYLQSKLSISFRTRLTRYVHDLYLSPDNNFYKVVNLDGRIDGADQFITTDIARFCDTFAAL